MKARYILVLFVGLLCANAAKAQQKSQILSDIQLTMEDFISDLNNINAEKNYFEMNLQSLAQTFTSASYFISNGVRNESFIEWVREYCTLHLTGLPIEHTLDILEHSVQKVDQNNSYDRRYRFDAAIMRTWPDNNKTSDIISFVVIWNGRQNYVSITEINGRLSEISDMDVNQLYSLANEHMKNGNDNMAILLFKQAVEKGHKFAATRLGQLYFKNKDYPDAFVWLAKSNDDSGETNYMLGWMYEQGLGTNQDWLQALSFYEKAAKKNYPLANANIRKLERKMGEKKMIYTGRIVNEQGNGINGASINIFGTDKYILTDYFGEFTLKGVVEGDKLIISSHTYKTIEVKYNKNLSNRITLHKEVAKNQQRDINHTVSNTGNNRTSKTEVTVTKKRNRTFANGVCRGKVRSENGKEINCGTVGIEGTDIRVLTDMSGEFELKGLQKGDVIIVTNIGYQPTVKEWNGEYMNFTLIKEKKTNNYQQTSGTQMSGQEKKSRTTSYSNTKLRNRTFANGVCRGKVRSENGKEINCGTVGIEGTDIRVLTDMSGEFELKGLQKGDVIIVSNIGYQTTVKEWNGGYMNFTLIKEK